MSGPQHIHCGQLSVGAEGGRSRDGNILRTPQHIWDYGCYNARCTAGREALQPLSGVKWCENNCSSIVCADNQRLPSHSIWPHSPLCWKAVVRPVTRRGRCCCERPSPSWPPPPGQDLQGCNKPESWKTFKNHLCFQAATRGALVRNIRLSCISVWTINSNLKCSFLSKTLVQ